ncbi:MAG TPA: hypothetical protein VMU16_15445 [Candidatus Binataceae bacterium]|nr:hypothetical protein [Candidatus Binataceae bacterium]
MSNLLDNPGAEWTNNEVPEIAATDFVEGAQTGATDGGLGIDNIPHQVLANRTSFLKQRQDVNITNIGVLQAFVAQFAGSFKNPGGYLKIPLNDVNLGAIVAIVQWGVVGDPGRTLLHDRQYAVTWPIAFPNACKGAIPVNLYNTTHGGITAASIVSGSLTKTGGTFVLDEPDGLFAALGGASTEVTDGLIYLTWGY